MRPLDVLGALRLEDGRLWVDAAHPFQVEDVREVLEGPVPYSYLTRARGSSKTTDLAAVALSALMAADDRLRAYWLAADADQGRLAIDAIGGFVARTRALSGRVEVQARRVVVPASGAVLEVLPADAPGAWGLTPHWLFADELANWADGPASRRLWEAASSAVAKRADARLVVLTTASSPDHFAFKVLEHARRSSLWRTSERDGAAPWMAADRLEEQRLRLPAAVFEQLFLNRWTAVAGSFLDPAVISAAFCLDGPALEREPSAFYAAGLDLGSVNDRSVLAIGHKAGDRVVLDRLQCWRGSRARPTDYGEVEAYTLQAHGRFGFTLRLDPWQGLGLAQRLRAGGVHAEEFTFSAASKQRLASTLLSTINAGNLALYEAEGLREELLALRLAQSASGAWSFDHRAGGHDDMAVAISLMTVALLEGLGGSANAYWLPDLGVQSFGRALDVNAGRPVQREQLWRNASGAALPSSQLVRIESESLTREELRRRNQEFLAEEPPASDGWMGMLW
ncbi:MAG: hypothetical protein M3065_21795 [Actinomycetota bacterium]|nr:hypothetical protein [Actinomycetota bacterium]